MERYTEINELLEVLDDIEPDECYETEHDTWLDCRISVINAPTADVAPVAEIANAIFDDIEDCLAVHAYTSKSEDYADGASDTIEWVDSKIAELRKKYMGEQV